MPGLPDGGRDPLADAKSGRRGGRRRVADVKAPRPADEQEVVHQRAVGPERLGADAGRRRAQIARPDLGYEPLEATDETPSVEESVTNHRDSSPGYS